MQKSKSLLNFIILLIAFIIINVGVNNKIFSKEIVSSLNVKISDDYILFDIKVNNTSSQDMYIPLREWFFNGRVRASEPVYVFGHLKSINGITYINKNANQKLIFGGDVLFGEMDYSTEKIPKFMVVNPGQTKMLEIQIEKTEVLPYFFMQDAYNIEIEMAVADNEILNEFNTIFQFDYNKYVVDSDIYKIQLNQHKKYKHYFTSKEYDSKKRFDDCLKNVFYLAFKNHITIKGELILKN